MTEFNRFEDLAIPVDELDATHFSAPWLGIARTAWIVIVSTVSVSFVAGLIVGLGQLSSVCTDLACHPLQLSLREAELNYQLGLSTDFYAWYTTITLGVFGFVFLAVGLLIFWRKPHDWMAFWLSIFLVMMGMGAIPVIPALEVPLPPIQWFSGTVFLFGAGSIPIMLATFPDGRFVPPIMRWMVLAWAVYMVGTTLLNSIPPAGIYSGPPSPPTQLMFLLGGLSQVYRYQHTANPAHRQQTKWVMFGFVGHVASVTTIIIAFSLFPSLTGNGLAAFVFDKYAFAFVGLIPILFIPMSLTFAILRFRLWDIDIIINRTLVYGLLTTLIAAIYILIVGVLGSIFQARGGLAPSLLATCAVAVSFHSLREQLQRFINRLMFGQREEPHTVLAQLSERLQTALLPGDLLATTVQTVVDALKLPYAAISIQSGEDDTIQAQIGINRTPTTQFPLTYQHETVGKLVVGKRSPGEELARADVVVLERVAQQMGAVVYAVRLQTELQQARERLVNAREEERRRIRRDLHDGLGPALASQTLKLDTALDLFESHAPLARELVGEVREQADSLLVDVRRLVHDLRPPALDELGLIGALKNSIMQMNASVNRTFFSFQSQDSLPPLSAAVEAAVYRITMEAITNVLKHAHAGQCAVRISTSEQDHVMQLCIEDDGIGLPQPVSPGVGLQSMRERAEELGGTVNFSIRKPQGSRIRVQLPLVPVEPLQ